LDRLVASDMLGRQKTAPRRILVAENAKCADCESERERLIDADARGVSSVRAEVSALRTSRAV
jgi:hypothetical protein